MSKAFHSVVVLDGSASGRNDAVVLGVKAGVAVANGTNPTVSVAFAEPIPGNYAVAVSCNENFPAFVTAKTAAGFTVTVEGTVSGGACTIDVIVVAA